MHSIEVDFKNNQKIEAEFNGIAFRGFQGIGFGQPAQILTQLTPPTVGRSIANIVRQLFLGGTIAYTSGRGENVFFLCREYRGRPDHVDTFERLAKTVVNASLFSQQISPCLQIRLMSLVPIWLFQMRNVSLSLRQKLYITTCLQLAWCGIRDLKSIADMKTLTVICDFHFADNVVAQQFNELGIPTVVMQHGIYSRTNPAPFTNGSAEHLLAYGAQTILEASACGMDASRVVEVGMPQIATGQIYPASKVSRAPLNVVGVEMSGYGKEQQDIELFNLAISVAADNGLRVAVKFHPGFPPQHYDYDFNNGLVLEMVTSEKSAEDFIDEVDICLCAGSTILVQNLLKMKPTLLFMKPGDPFFNKYTAWCAVESEADCNGIISALKKNPELIERQMLDTREFFTLTNGVRGLYNAFYEKLAEKVAFYNEESI